MFQRHDLRVNSLLHLLRERAVGEGIGDNVAPAEKFTVDVHLRESGPVGVHLHALAQSLVLQDVHREVREGASRGGVFKDTYTTYSRDCIRSTLVNNAVSSKKGLSPNHWGDASSTPA